MMAINTRGYVWNTALGNAVSLASLAKSASPLPHHPLYLPPPWAVQQSLIVLVSAHTLTILL
jgi:hypothetical protein